MRPFLTIFIPAYNEQANLEHSVNVLRDQMSVFRVAYEILIVDDGSQDETAVLADSLAAQYAEVRALHHRRNMGMGGAFLTAIAEARGEWLILIPADLALEPGELVRYLEAAPQADIVVGLRSNLSDYSWFRKLVSWSNIRLIQFLFGMRLRQFQYISMYRLDFLRQVRLECWRSAFFLPEILIKARDRGLRLVEVEVHYVPRLGGQSTGARFGLILHTVVDLFCFWLRWVSAKAQRYSSRRFT